MPTLRPILLVLCFALSPLRAGGPPTAWTNSVGMAFVPIPAGTFTMGSDAPEADADERPLHTVVLRRPFLMAATEVTQAQWKAVMGSNPSRFQGDDLPVDQVSWVMAKAFLARLNTREHTHRYRLPTEAEWEYACRAGAPVDRHAEEGPVGWFDPNSGGRTRPVGLKPANAWGLHDMLGNVYEWCEDWKGSYPAGRVKDPGGPRKGLGRVARGGSWFVHANRSRPFFRDGYNPEHAFADMGLRVVADVVRP